MKSLITLLANIVFVVFLNGNAQAGNLHYCIENANWSESPVARSDLRDTTLAVKTSSGNYAVIKVKSGDDLFIERLDLFTSQGAAIAGWNSLKIQSSYTFDLDSGGQDSSGADLWWQGVRPGVHNLNAQNGAMISVCNMPQNNNGNLNTLSTANNRVHTVDTSNNTLAQPINNGMTVSPDLDNSTASGQSKPSNPSSSNSNSNRPITNWDFWMDTTEETARKGKCTVGPNLTRCPPSYCESDKHCQFGHRWGLNFWDQEYYGFCIQNECRENREIGLDPNGSMCKSNYECNNKNFEGNCELGQCRSIPRQSCDTPGAMHVCVTIDGKQGKASCREWHKLGTCLEF